MTEAEFWAGVTVRGPGMRLGMRYLLAEEVAFPGGVGDLARRLLRDAAEYADEAGLCWRFGDRSMMVVTLDFNSESVELWGEPAARVSTTIEALP